MEQKFKPGDVVMLKSGGVPMTAEIVSESRDGSTYAVTCVWFVETDQRRDVFMQEALQEYVEEANGGFFVG